MDLEAHGPLDQHRSQRREELGNDVLELHRFGVDA
jgi:hypothetical protein